MIMQGYPNFIESVGHTSGRTTHWPHHTPRIGRGTEQPGGWAALMLLYVILTGVTLSQDADAVPVANLLFRPDTWRKPIYLNKTFLLEGSHRVRGSPPMIT
jgi:hypothetical protein